MENGICRKALRVTVSAVFLVPGFAQNIGTVRVDASRVINSFRTPDLAQ